jgi:hypothetical protein
VVELEAIDQEQDLRVAVCGDAAHAPNDAAPLVVNDLKARHVDLDQLAEVARARRLNLRARDDRQAHGRVAQVDLKERARLDALVEQVLKGEHGDVHDAGVWFHERGGGCGGEDRASDRDDAQPCGASSLMPDAVMWALM